MDILEQKRRVITTAIIAVVLTGIVIAAIVATPLINQLHSQASRSAGNVADAKTQNIQATLDQHQDLARQTASRSELGRVMSEYVNGNLAVGVARTFSRPRLEDAANIIDHATFADAAKFSSGIKYTLIHGVPVVKNGKFQKDVHPGKAARGTVR